MRIDPAGWPFIAWRLLPAVLAASLGYPVWAAAVRPCWRLFFLYFFRDPERQSDGAARMTWSRRQTGG